MSQSFQIGAITLAACWEPMIHAKIRALPFPPVEGVDCSNCRMVHARIFPRHVKCCSRTPEFPNFLVGSLLENGPESEGSRLVTEWVKGTRNTPLFVPVPPSQRRYEAQLHSFEEWPVCPMYKDGMCTVYEHRPFICMGYHCFFPAPPELYAFWNSLSTLLALITANASQYLAIQIGMDRQKFREAWQSVQSEDEVWDGEQLTPTFHKLLWQELDPETFYKACYHYILDHADTIREELDQFRRAQLLRQLAEEPEPDAARKKQIETQPTEPHPLAPDATSHELFMKELVVNFAKNTWTFHELESHILWYHQKVWPDAHPTADAGGDVDTDTNANA